MLFLITVLLIGSVLETSSLATPQIQTNLEKHNQHLDDLDDVFIDVWANHRPRPVQSIEDLIALGVNVTDYPSSVIEDANLSVPGLIEKYGYNMETHHVTTEDGYILEMHRILARKSWPFPRKHQPVFLMHGLLSSSSSWVFMGPEVGLGYILSDLGYDVWMGNARGNRYSRRHVSLDPDGSRSQRRRYWSFSWHEIGVHDLPTMIDYVLAETKYEKLHYIGHSQGSTSFFVMASERPEYNDKILSMQALAPVAYMSNLKSPLVRAVVLLLNTLDIATSILGMYEFLPTDELHEVGAGLCSQDTSLGDFVCSNLLFLLFGFNQDQMNTTMLPVFLGHMPAGCATNQMIHYGQGIRSGQFRKYNWGLISNRLKYGSRHPPEYKVENIRAPVAFHYGSNDWLAEPVDVYQLYEQLPNPIGIYNVPHPQWNHLDFVMAIDAKPLLYNHVIEIMRTLEVEEIIE